MGSVPSILNVCAQKVSVVWMQVQTQSQSAEIWVWLGGHPSGALRSCCVTAYLFWKEGSVAWDASIEANLTFSHALAACVGSSNEVLGYIFKTRALGRKAIELPSWQRTLQFQIFLWLLVFVLLQAFPCCYSYVFSTTSESPLRSAAFLQVL